MDEEDDDERENRITVDVGLEIFLKGREESVRPIVTFRFHREHIEDWYEDNPVEAFMSIVIGTIRSVIDDKTENLLILSNSNYDKFIFEADQIQAINISSPKEALEKALKQ